MAPHHPDGLDAGGGDAGAVTADFSSVRHGISQLQKDFATLQSDESDLPGYLPPQAPSQANVNMAIAAANAATASATSITNGYINQANADVTTAYQYAAQVYTAGNCGAAPSAPSSQPHPPS